MSDRCIERIAAHQHGVFTRAQALACGVREGSIRWRIDAGRWIRLYPKVYALAGTPRSWHQRALATCFHLAGPLSHGAAARVRGFPGFERAALEVTAASHRNRRRIEGVRIHSTNVTLNKADITLVDRIPVTSAARTLVELATVEAEEVIEACLDDVLRRRFVSLTALDVWLRNPRRAGHRGARALREIVDSRMLTGATESPLEARILRLIGRSGLPLPVVQYVVSDGPRFIGRVDLAYPDERVAIEVDGFRFHDDRRGFDHERARANDIVALGWKLLRVTSQHLDEHPREVVGWIERALAK